MPSKTPPGSKASVLLDQTCSLCSSSLQHLCSLDFLTARLPPLAWASQYSLEMLTGDVIAGVTTALTVIPQGIGEV